MAGAQKHFDNSLSNGKPSSHNERDKHAKATPLRRPNGEAAFTEGDVHEIYEDRFDFFRNVLKLPKAEAERRANSSTAAWRREIFGESRA